MASAIVDEYVVIVSTPVVALPEPTYHHRQSRHLQRSKPPSTMGAVQSNLADHITYKPVPRPPRKLQPKKILVKRAPTPAPRPSQLSPISSPSSVYPESSSPRPNSESESSQPIWAKFLTESPLSIHSSRLYRQPSGQSTEAVNFKANAPALPISKFSRNSKSLESAGSSASSNAEFAIVSVTGNPYPVFDHTQRRPQGRTKRFALSVIIPDQPHLNLVSVSSFVVESDNSSSGKNFVSPTTAANQVALRGQAVNNSSESSSEAEPAVVQTTITTTTNTGSISALRRGAVVSISRSISVTSTNPPESLYRQSTSSPLSASPASYDQATTGETKPIPLRVTIPQQTTSTPSKVVEYTSPVSSVSPTTATNPTMVNGGLVDSPASSAGYDADSDEDSASPTTAAGKADQTLASTIAQFSVPPTTTTTTRTTQSRSMINLRRNAVISVSRSVSTTSSATSSASPAGSVYCAPKDADCEAYLANRDGDKGKVSKVSRFKVNPFHKPVSKAQRQQQHIGFAGQTGTALSSGEGEDSDGAACESSSGSDSFATATGSAGQLAYVSPNTALSNKTSSTDRDQDQGKNQGKQPLKFITDYFPPYQPPHPYRPPSSTQRPCDIQPKQSTGSIPNHTPGLART